jgi:hypothetical protein
VATAHLGEIVPLLVKIDPKLGEIAQIAKAPDVPPPSPSKTKNKNKTKSIQPNNRRPSSSSSVTNKSSSSSRVVRPRNLRESDAEKKRVKKELDKVLKAHKKASKLLDEYRSEKSDARCVLLGPQYFVLFFFF